MKQKRLTKRTDGDKAKPCFCEPEHAEEYSTKSKRDAVNKLGKLEDIEDELGVDLITLFKALKAKTLFVKTGLGIKETIEHNVGWGMKYLAFEDGKFMLVCDVLLPLELNPNANSPICVRLKMPDYGKTWALTKEELERIEGEKLPKGDGPSGSE